MMWVDSYDQGDLMKYLTQFARHLVLAGLVVTVISGCASTPKPDDGPPADLSAVAPKIQAPFIPENYVARARFVEGQYSNLLSPTTHAVWVDKHLAEIKLIAAQQEGSVRIPQGLIEDALLISDHYLLIECHIDTLFPDSSIAYDVSGLRNIDVYLETSDAINVYPLQHFLISTATEEAVGALKRFTRSNLFIFPLVDVITGEAVFPPGSDGVQLVIEGFSSRYAFSWMAQEPIPTEPVVDTTPQDMGDVIQWRPSESETVQVVKVGFVDLYTKLGALTRLPRD